MTPTDDDPDVAQARAFVSVLLAEIEVLTGRCEGRYHADLPPFGGEGERANRCAPVVIQLGFGAIGAQADAAGVQVRSEQVRVRVTARPLS